MGHISGQDERCSVPVRWSGIPLSVLKLNQKGKILILKKILKLTYDSKKLPKWCPNLQLDVQNCRQEIVNCSGNGVRSDRNKIITFKNYHSLKFKGKGWLLFPVLA